MDNKVFSRMQWIICGWTVLSITAYTAGSVAPYTTAMVSDYVAGLEDNPYVFPTRCGNGDFVLGQSYGWAANPEIPKQDLYGFAITDPAVKENLYGWRDSFGRPPGTIVIDPTLTSIVLMSGNHNTEYSGNWALQGMIDFLISDDARAAQLRKKTMIFVYPMVNPDGRYLMTGRGNPELTSLGYSNHNRVWNKKGISTIDVFTHAMRYDTAFGARYFFDFHDDSTSNCLLTIYDKSNFSKALKIREPGVSITLDPGSAGMARLWADSTGGLNAYETYTPEFTSTQSAAYYEAMGRNYALSLYDTLIPEPGLTALMLLGGVVLALRRRRDRSF